MSSAADLRARQHRAAALLALALVLPVVLLLVDHTGHRHRMLAAGWGEPPWWPAAFGAAGAVLAAALLWRWRRQPWRWRFTVLVGPVAAGVPALFHLGGAGPDDGVVLSVVTANAVPLAGALVVAARLLAVGAERLVAGAPTEELVRRGVTAAVPLRGSSGALWLAADALVLDPDARRRRLARRTLPNLAGRPERHAMGWESIARVEPGHVGEGEAVPVPGPAGDAVRIYGADGDRWLVPVDDARRVADLLERRRRTARRAVVESPVDADEVRYLGWRQKPAGRDFARLLVFFTVMPGLAVYCLVQVMTGAYPPIALLGALFFVAPHLLLGVLAATGRRLWRVRLPDRRPQHET